MPRYDLYASGFVSVLFCLLVSALQVLEIMVAGARERPKCRGAMSIGMGIGLLLALLSSILFTSTLK